MKPRDISSIISPGLLAALMIIICSCTHDTGLSLKNDIPEFLSADSIVSTLYYPDSAVCTLSVSDLNDSILDPACLGLDDSMPMVWPGCTHLVNPGLDDKAFIMHLSGQELGQWQGLMQIQDMNGGSCMIPFDVSRFFIEPFDAFPLNGSYWKTYNPDDSDHVILDYTSNPQLKFSFVQDSSDTVPKTAGIYSAFAVSGDLKMSVDFELRDDMYSGFETSCFLSTNADTGRYSGKSFGFYLTGQGQWVSIKSRSVNFQVVSYNAAYYAGTLFLERKESTALFLSKPAGPGNPDTLASFTFPAADSLYIHLRMKVDDMARNRHCTWNNLAVTRGRLVF